MRVLERDRRDLQGEREKEISLCEKEMCVRKIEKEYLWMKERERESVCV